MSELEIEILQLLSVRYELTSSQIMDLLNKKLGKNCLGFNKVQLGNLHLALYKLEVAGYITRRMEKTEGKKYRKAYYKITHKGGNRLIDIDITNFVFA